MTLTDGVDFDGDQVWIEFEEGLDPSYAESLVADAGYTIVTTVMNDPPGYIVTSDAGLWSPAAVLDITARVSRIAFAEPMPL